MLIDGHCHIFNELIVENMKKRPSMVKALGLNVHDAVPRLSPQALSDYATANGIDRCVLLPTASPGKVRIENDRFIEFTKEFPRLSTLATLHPAMTGLSDEIRRVSELGINGFKFSSFSQRFDPSSPEFEAVLVEIERLGPIRKTSPVVVFDTFTRADFYFSANRDHLTTAVKLDLLAERHPGINFIGAHMGGLLSNFDELRRNLEPRPNLFLDTSNATHTLKEEEFVELLRIHGPAHILFGTDWPWFLHVAEKQILCNMLVKAGFDDSGKKAVFGENAAGLFGFSLKF